MSNYALPTTLPGMPLCFLDDVHPKQHLCEGPTSGGLESMSLETMCCLVQSSSVFHATLLCRMKESFDMGGLIMEVNELIVRKDNGGWDVGL